MSLSSRCLSNDPLPEETDSQDKHLIKTKKDLAEPKNYNFFIIASNLTTISVLFLYPLQAFLC